MPNILKSRAEVQLKNLYATRCLRVFIYFALFLLPFSIRVPYISHFAFWPDEWAQADVASHGFLNPEIVDLAPAHLSQPPLDCYLESAGIYYFGFNEVGMRIHAVIEGALACLLFFIFLNKYYGVISAILGYTLFTFNPWLIRYSFEGRPYSTAIFCVVLFILTFQRFFTTENFKNFMLIVIVQLILLFSIVGLPFVLLFSYILFSIITCIFFEGDNRLQRALYIFIPFSLAIILFLPNFMKILIACGPARSHDEHLISKFATLIQNYSILDYVRFFSFTNDYKYLLIACLAFYILAIFPIKRHKALFSNRNNQIRLILLGVFFSFPFLYHFSFYMMLMSSNGRFDQRVILLFVPITIAVISIGFNDLISIIEQNITRLRYRVFVYVIIAACVLLMFSNNLAHNRKFLAKQFPNQNPSNMQPSSWVELNGGRQEYAPGMTIKLSGNVCVMPPPKGCLDAYLLVWPSSGGMFYSILDTGAAVQGIKPRKICTTVPIHWYGTLWHPVVRKGTPTGWYTVGLFCLPSGMPLNINNTIAYAYAEILIAKLL
ncbi:MAG: glycosyltransferase family 39 protein [Candidatus Aureabacteria bacterium]|nr:glycosyltransferase family 39 protein [Candidatus Auribacterota bacterium]